MITPSSGGRMCVPSGSKRRTIGPMAAWRCSRPPMIIRAVAAIASDIGMLSPTGTTIGSRLTPSPPSPDSLAKGTPITTRDLPEHRPRSSAQASTHTAIGLPNSATDRRFESFKRPSTSNDVVKLIPTSSESRTGIFGRASPSSSSVI